MNRIDKSTISSQFIRILEKLAAAAGQPLMPVARGALLQKLDTRIREVYLTGTIGYEAHEANAAQEI